ncbi:hypothetical protein RHSIM_Rhsim05G0061900 [Rhododendron simsii]|uniref:Nodulin-like domain-containing protein n=1 Tax=Rhododendron simsii TaxID=118357 RepID=A0A834GYU9_RHOSS|nr:hypothetical protein RHSIM_Rhsim05G0061900 [Rhododendron simsii]
MRCTLSPASPAGKWMGFVAAVWVQAISGNNYTFSNYSDALKTLMSLTQLQLNNLSVAKDVGKAFGILAGIAYDRVPTPVILLIGSVEGFVGYGVQWLVVSKKIRPLPYWQVSYKKNRGPVSGILKGYVGLSTAIFTDLCAALFAENPSTFLLMLAVVPFLVCLTAVFFLREIPPSSTSAEDETQESRYFRIFYAVSIAIGMYLLVFDMTGPHGRTISQAFAVILLLLLASPILVPLYITMQSSIRRSDTEHSVTEPLLDAEKKPEAESVVEAAQMAEEGVVADQHRRRRPVIGEDHTAWEAFQTVDFWILFVSFLCGVGTGLAVMNNMGQMGLALGYADVSIFVSLISIWGFFGRIASGSVSEYFVKKAGTPRPLWNAVSQILMAVGYIMMAIALPGSLFIGSIVVGICYGVRLAVTVPTASELFGLRHYGLIYNILILNLPLGSFLFSGLLAGFLYDAQATTTAGGSNTCIGAHCYRLVFLVMAFACIVGFGLDVLLAIRTKGVYARIYAGKKSKKSGGESNGQ